MQGSREGAESRARTTRWGALSSGNYRDFTIGNATSLVGTWTQRVAVGWLAWELTQSPAWLGVIAVADMIPTLLVGPLAGAAADRHDRMMLVKRCQYLAMVQALMLLGAALTGLLSIWLLLVLSLALGIIQSYDQPARLALIGSLVPREDLASAVAINSIAFNLARFIGPVLAGLAIAVSGASLAFALNALSFVVCIVMLERVRLPAEASPHRGTGSFLADILDGIRYTFAHPGLAVVLAVITAVNVGARPILELLPAFATEIYASDAAGFAALGAAMGAGATLGGAWMAMGGSRLRLTTIGLLGAAMLVVLLPVVGLSGRLWLGLPAMAVFGFFLASSAIALQSLVQLATAPQMRGRVMGLFGVLFRAGPAAGGLGMGLIAEGLGLGPPVLICAMGIAAVTLWAFLRRKVLFDTLEGRETEG